MATITLTFQSVSVPTNTSASVTVYEDVGNDGSGSATDPNGKSYDNSATATLADGTTSYDLSGFDGGAGNAYWLEYSLGNSDVTRTASIGHDASLSV